MAKRQVRKTEMNEENQKALEKTTADEIWRSVAGYEGLYEVSDQGRVRSLVQRNNRWKPGILKPRKTPNGYLRVTLYKDGKAKSMSVHRLVAEAFVPNPQNLETVNHKDEDKTNNSASNLEWMTHKDNNNYGSRNRRAGEANINNPKLSKPVQQLDKSTGELLATFPSTREAERIAGISQSNISACCLGKCKTAGGYKWRYS